MKFAKHHLLNLNKTTTCFKKPSKNDEKCFLFRLKNSFRSQDISVFVLNFSSDHSHKKQIVWICYVKIYRAAQNTGDDLKKTLKEISCLEVISC